MSFFCRLGIWPIFGWGFGPKISGDLGISNQGVDGDLAILDPGFQIAELQKWLKVKHKTVVGLNFQWSGLKAGESPLYKNLLMIKIMIFKKWGFSII